jgi:hypothetical protein
MGDLDQKLHCPVISFHRSIAYAEKDASYVDSFGEPQIPALQGPRENMLMSQMRRLEWLTIFMRLASHRYHRFELRETSSRANPRRRISRASPRRRSPPASLNGRAPSPLLPGPSPSFRSPVKPVYEKTSRILERLEAPKSKKQRSSKPSSTTTS